VALTREGIAPVPSTSPSGVAALVLNSAVATYVRVTQMPGAESFILDKIKKMILDNHISGARLADDLIRAGQTLRPKNRPLPTVIFAVFVSCAYAVQAVHCEAAGQQEEAWRFASDAQYFCGVARGAAGELVAKHEFTHSAERTALATRGRKKLKTAKLERLKKWASRSHYEGMLKGAAAIAMEGDGFPASADYIKDLITEAFPKDAWKKRPIDR
jgi:hypothetical protein